MIEPTRGLFPAVGAARESHALPGRTAPSGPGALSRPVPDARLGIPAVVDHMLRQASKPQHYDPIVRGYQPRAPTRGRRW